MQKVLVENNADGTTLITINRPERRNAICNETALLLQKAFVEFERSPAQRAAVLTGAGNEAFAGLAARVSHKVAMELMLLCRTLDAQRAYNVGLVNEVVPTGQQVPVALRMAREMADFSPLVLKTLKRFVTEGVLAQGPSERSGRTQRALHEVSESEDAEEATAAVKE